MTEVCRDNNIGQDDFIFIQHYVRGGFEYDDFSSVTFEWNSRENRFSLPNWKYITQVVVEELCGGKIA